VKYPPITGEDTGQGKRILWHKNAQPNQKRFGQQVNRGSEYFLKIQKIFNNREIFFA
jgi:hypothetical protein